MDEVVSAKNELKISIYRFFTDESGKSQFGTIDIPTNLVDFAPPAPKVYLSSQSDAKKNFFLIIPPKWYGQNHPVPSRQLMTIVSGSIEVIASDGIKRTFSVGDTALFEDTWGEGHITNNTSDDNLVVSVVQF